MLLDRLPSNQKVSGAKVKSIIKACAAIILLTALWPAVAAAQTADLILMNGKVITVDDRFTIAQALAIKAGRIIAVDSNANIEKLKGTGTQVIDLQLRSVIPGLIDNHAHYMRAAEYWHREVRLDGITSHKQASDLIREKVREAKPGEWVVVLGGWSEE
jgi:predicted amidohydrolase YtcJ